MIGRLLCVGTLAVGVILFAPTFAAPQPRMQVDWYHQQNCLYAPNPKTGAGFGKPANMCPRNDPVSPGYWGLRQRV